MGRRGALWGRTPQRPMAGRTFGEGGRCAAKYKLLGLGITNDDCVVVATGSRLLANISSGGIYSTRDTASSGTSIGIDPEHSWPLQLDAGSGRV